MTARFGNARQRENRLSCVEHYRGELATISVLQDWRSVEHAFFVKIQGPAFLVHRGGKLNPEAPFQCKIERNGKISRICRAPVNLGNSMHVSALDTLLPTPTYRAALERTGHEDPDSDCAVADNMLEDGPFRREVTPKPGFALWATSDGHHHVGENPAPTTRC